MADFTINKAQPLGDPELQKKLATLAAANKAGGTKAVAEVKQQMTNRTAAAKIINSPTATLDQKKAANEILNPKKPNLFQSAVGSVSDSLPGKAFMGILSGLDYARGAVVSTVKEGADALADLSNAPGHQYVDASFSDWWRQTRNHYGTGEALREMEAAEVAGGGDGKLFGLTVFKNPEALRQAGTTGAIQGPSGLRDWLKSEDGGQQLKYTSGGKVANIGVGLVGDIGLDPTTYLTMGGTKFSGMSAEALASHALQAGEAGVAQKVVKGGKWALTPKELEKIGLAGEGGIHFRVPGTGAMGRTFLNRSLKDNMIADAVAKGMTREAAERTISGTLRTAAIPGTEALARFTPVGVYGSLRATVRGTSLAGDAAKFMGGKYAGLKQLMLDGTPEEFGHAFNTMEAVRAATGMEKIAADDISRQWVNFESTMVKLGVDPIDAYNMLADPENVSDASKRIIALGPEGATFVNDFRSWAQDVLPAKVNEYAGAEIIRPRTGWQPSLRPTETRDYLIMTFGEKGGGAQRMALGKSASEVPAELIEGGEFLGQALVSTADSVRMFDEATLAKYGGALNPRQQAHEILVQRMATLGEDTVMAMFDEDITKAMPAAIRNYAHRIYTKRLEGELLQRGVASSIYENVLDTRLVAGEAALTQAKRRLHDMRLARRVDIRERGGLDAARQDLTATAQRIVGKIDERLKMVDEVAARNQRMNLGEDEIVRLREYADSYATRAASLDAKADEAASRLYKVVKDPDSAFTPSDLLNDNTYWSFQQINNDLQQQLALQQDTLTGLFESRGKLLEQLDMIDEGAPLEGMIAAGADRDATRAALMDLINDQEDLISLSLLVAQPNQAKIGLDGGRTMQDLDFFAGRLKEIDQATRDLEMLATLRAAAETNPSQFLDERLALESKLRNNYWTDLNAKGSPTATANKLHTLSGDMRETVSMLQRFADSSNRFRSEWLMGFHDEAREAGRRLQMLNSDAAAMGRPDLFERYAALERMMPSVDGVALTNPASEDGVWYLSTKSLDTSMPSSWLAATDALDGLGVGLASEAGATATPVVAKASNPKLYSPQYSVFDHTLPEADLVARYGTSSPPELAAMRADMLEYALRMPGELFTDAIHPEFKNMWLRAKQLLDDGEEATMQSALMRTFDPEAWGADSSVFQGIAGQAPPSHVGGVHKTMTAGNADEVFGLMTAWGNRFKDMTDQRTADAFDSYTSGGYTSNLAGDKGGTLEDLVRRMESSLTPIDRLQLDVELEKLGFPENITVYRGWSFEEHQFNKTTGGISGKSNWKERYSNAPWGPYENGSFFEDTARGFAGYLEDGSRDVETFTIARNQIIGFGHNGEGEIMYRSSAKNIPYVRAGADPLGVLNASRELPKGDYIVNRLSDLLLGQGRMLDDEARKVITTSWADSIGKRHDAIVVPNAQGKWQVIALKPGVINTIDDKPVVGLKTIAQAREEMAAQLPQAVAKRIPELRAEAKSLDKAIDRAYAGQQNIEMQLIESNLQLADITAEVRESFLDRKYGTYLEMEYRHREEAASFMDSSRSYLKKAEEMERELQNSMTFMTAVNMTNARDQIELVRMGAQMKRLDAQHALAEAEVIRETKDIRKLEKRIDKVEGRMTRIMSRNIAESGNPLMKQVRKDMSEALQLQVRMLSNETYAPNAIVHALTDMTKLVGDPTGVDSMLRYLDKVTNVWKAQAIARPGFHFRNYMGGLINNWLGEVEPRHYKGFVQRFGPYRAAALQGASHEEALAAVAKKFGQDDALRIASIVEAGITSGGQAAETKLLSQAHRGNLNPFSTSFKLYQKNSAVMVDIENVLRGTMAWDRLAKGYDMDSVISDVARYHFEYDDLSRFERNVVRRVVPFYTWTRKNLPLQIERALENPRGFTHYMSVKRSVEEVTQDEPVVPNWFNGQLPIRLPFAVGGTAQYLKVDAPFKNLGIPQGSGPMGALLSQANPIFKTPIEMYAGQKFFNNAPFKDGFQPVPSVWEKLGVPEAMRLFGKATKDANGNWVARDKDLYMVEQFMPLLSNARRAAPSEKKYEDKLNYTIMSMAFGISAEANTAEAQLSELKRRNAALQSLTADLQSTGYVAKKGS